MIRGQVQIFNQNSIFQTVSLSKFVIFSKFKMTVGKWNKVGGKPLSTTAFCHMDTPCFHSTHYANRNTKRKINIKHATEPNGRISCSLEFVTRARSCGVVLTPHFLHLFLFIRFSFDRK